MCMCAGVCGRACDFTKTILTLLSSTMKFQERPSVCTISQGSISRTYAWNLFIAFFLSVFHIITLVLRHRIPFANLSISVLSYASKGAHTNTSHYITSTPTHAYTRSPTDPHARIHTHARAHKRTHARTHTRTHTHTHTHTHTSQV